MSEKEYLTQDHLHTARSAYARFVALAEQAVDPEAPTRLRDWNVSDLIAHVTWGMSVEASALMGGAPGRREEASLDLAAALVLFERASRTALADNTMVALPAAEVPFAYAAPLFAFEAALHAADLAHAIGEDHRLSDAEVAACRDVMGPMLDLVAATTQSIDRGDLVDIDLIISAEDGREEETIRLSASEQGWQRGVPGQRAAAGQATTTLSGDVRSVILFVTGRIGADALQVAGDPVHARRFKEYFPGP